MSDAALKSITIRFDPVEDRLLLRLLHSAETGAEAGCLLHVTRRIARELRGQLQRLAELSAQAPQHLAPSTRTLVEAAHHQAMADQVPIQPGPPMPKAADAAPRLVVAMAVGRHQRSGAWVLQLSTNEGAPLTLTLADATLHGLLALLNRQVSQADWELPTLGVEKAPEWHSSAQMLREFH